MTTRRGPIFWLLTVLAVLCAAPGVGAQEVGAGEPAAPEVAQTLVTRGEVDVRLDRLGVGGQARPGAWTGIRLILTDRAPGGTARPVIARVRFKDPDGDEVSFERAVTLNAGVSQSVWLYARLPFSAGREPLLRFEVYEARESGDTYVPGRRLGELIADAAPRLVGPSWGLMGVVGVADAGLSAYSFTVQNTAYPPEGHEPTQVMGISSVRDLPDRWQGYADLEALVWTLPAQGPEQLSPTQAEALRMWVERGGGHLIVILPPVGETWTSRVHPLSDIMPQVAPAQRVEGAAWSAYRRLLTRVTDRPLPGAATVHTFEPLATATPSEAVRLINGPDGRTIVVRRIAGTGAVTLVGLDLTARPLQASGLFQPDVFWSRILGKRHELISPADLAVRMNTGRSQVSYYGREQRVVDESIPLYIDKRGTAAAGILLAFLAFAAYWLLAGLGTFVGLRSKGLHQHSWLAFVGGGVVFTALCWGGATVLRPTRTEATHLTFLDAVHGQPFVRARAWMSVMLPGYGERMITIDDDGTETTGFSALVAPWDTVDLRVGQQFGSFPDSRSYTIDARRPDSVEVPTRSTTKQFQVDWAGGSPWRLPRPVEVDAEGNVTGPGEVRVERTGTSPNAWRLAGTLLHELPYPLTDVTLILIRGQAGLGVAPTGAATLPAEAYGIARPGAWAPGEPLVLDGAFAPSGRQGAAIGVRGNLLSILTGRADGRGMVQPQIRPGLPGTGAGRQRLDAISLFSLLQPPDTSVSDTQLHVQRSSTHGLDLARWFTQPCLIVLGHVPESAGPIPIEVGGRVIPTSGHTAVRLIIPLEDRPPAYPDPLGEGEGEASETGGSAGEG